MPVSATVTAGYTFTTGDKATAAALNAAAIPSVVVPDGKDFVFGAGTVGAPSISFTGDSDTGLAQLAGGDTVSVVCGGVEAFRFINDQALAMPGLDGTPAYSFAGDPNTGINRDTADEVDIVCGGNRIVTASAAGVSVVGTVTATGTIDAPAVTVNGASVMTTGINTSQVAFSTDFIGRIESTGFTATTTGTGSVAVTNTGIQRGVVNMAVQANGDRAVLHMDVQPNAIGSRLTFRVGVNGTALSNPTERYYVMIGVFDSSADTPTSTTGNAAWFEYLDSSSAQWVARTRLTSTTQSTATDVTVALAAAGSPTRFDIVKVSGGFQFYINNVLKATNTTTSGGGGTVAVILHKSAGSSNSGLAYVDSFEFREALVRT
jgi:hypothetical protein